MWVAFWSEAVQFKWKIKMRMITDNIFRCISFFVKKMANGVTFHSKPNINNSNYHNYIPERMWHQSKTFAPGSDGKLQTNCSHSSSEDALITARACRQNTGRKSFPAFLSGFCWQPSIHVFPTPSVSGRPETSNDLLARLLNSFFLLNILRLMALRGNGYLGWEPPLKATGRQTKPQSMRARPAQTQTIMKNSLDDTFSYWRAAFLKVLRVTFIHSADA